MPISYVTTDLQFDSTSNLSVIVGELGEKVIVHLNDWVGDVYRVAVGIGNCDSSPDDAVSLYCSLLEKLSGTSRVLWKGCTRRVVDIAFESGTEPECATYHLPDKLVRRLSALGISIAVTIYRVGAYSGAASD